MLFDKITPFVRFAAKQNMSNCWFNDGKEIVGFDQRIYFVLSGHGSVKIGDEVYDLSPDTFVMWRAGTPYRYVSEKKNPLICVTCNFDFTFRSSDAVTPVAPSLVKEFDKSGLLEENVRFSDAESLNGTVFLPNASDLRPLMLELEESYSLKRKFSSLKCNNIIQEILLKVAYRTENDLSKNNELVSAVTDYLREHFRDNPTNKEIGAKFGYHPNYINSLLIKHTEMTIHKYLLYCKMTYAVQQLLTSDKNVSEIANEINIPDTQYFARLFKKYYKKSPSQFRFNK
ncbi:MAG: helix-turn-helix transcriptional regulator [Clostridia bacterium]|nr:helix-turn-helix transcriptional regulator [Clostridia bacterium]